MTPHDRALLQTAKSQMHDWGLKEPRCALGYVNVERGLPEKLLKGPPVGMFFRKDRQVIEWEHGWDEHRHCSYTEHKIFFGSRDACTAFTQITTELDTYLQNSCGIWKATDWCDYLFEAASRTQGFGAITVQPATWSGETIQFIDSERPRPDHVFGLLHNSPFLATEIQLSTMLADADSGVNSLAAETNLEACTKAADKLPELLPNQQRALAYIKLRQPVGGKEIANHVKVDFGHMRKWFGRRGVLIMHGVYNNHDGQGYRWRSM